MHSLTLRLDQRTAKLIDDTVSIWLTLTASLIAPIVDHEPQLEDRDTYRPQAEGLAALLFDGPASSVPGVVKAAPPGFRTEAILNAFHYASRPHIRNIVKGAHAEPTLLISKLVACYPFSLRQLKVYVYPEQCPDFARQEPFKGVLLKLFDAADEEWHWCELLQDGQTKSADSSGAGGELSIASKGTSLTLTSSHCADTGLAAAMQAVWQHALQSRI